MAISLQREWRVPGNAELAWRQWDDEYVIHHLLSNDTYRLTELPCALIDYLSRSGPRSTIDIAAHLGCGTSDIADVLLELARLDLVTCQS